tara:strand:- start:140 stop:523 length:384 start_codon:yes stop_codon:yes gene_type:complete
MYHRKGELFPFPINLIKEGTIMNNAKELLRSNVEDLTDEEVDSIIQHSELDICDKCGTITQQGKSKKIQQGKCPKCNSGLDYDDEGLEGDSYSYGAKCSNDECDFKGREYHGLIFTCYYGDDGKKYS